MPPSLPPTAAELQNFKIKIQQFLDDTEAQLITRLTNASQPAVGSNQTKPDAWQTVHDWNQELIFVMVQHIKNCHRRMDNLEDENERLRKKVRDKEGEIRRMMESD